MDANELKEYIITNNKISLVLESLGCHKIKEYPTEYRAALPNKENATAVCVKKENLYVAIRSSNIDKQGDIFTLIMEIKHMTFGKAVRLLHSYLGLQYKYSKQKKEKQKTTSVLDVFRKVKRERYIVNQDIPIYDEDVLKEYIPYEHISWVHDGIMPFACQRFNIGYSFDKKRIIIPWRYWCGENENEYVGVVGRTTVQGYDMLDIPKYICLKPFNKGNNIYGLYENYQAIQENKYAVVFEAEKSVLKRYSRKDGTGVAVGCHSISDRQVQILIGLNVDIIIAFDKDVLLTDVWKECEKFYKIRNVYYVYDKWGLLKEKESPADLPQKKYQFMLKYKVKYDDDKHNQFVKKGDT